MRPYDQDSARAHQANSPEGQELPYFRRLDGSLVRLPGAPGSPEFMVAYTSLVAERAGEAPRVEIGSTRTMSGTMLVWSATSVHSLSPLSRPKPKRVSRNILERFRREHGDHRLELLQPKHACRADGCRQGRHARLRA
jgi:hypothetical protein